jgi:hypothetical protein
MTSSSINYTIQIPQTYINWYLTKNPEPDEKFLAWISKVEKKIQKKMLLYLTDLPDEDYMEYFESKYTPSEMVQIIYKSNGFN